MAEIDEVEMLRDSQAAKALTMQVLAIGVLGGAAIDVCFWEFEEFGDEF